jgi:hypothetical protein
MSDSSSGSFSGASSSRPSFNQRLRARYFGRPRPRPGDEPEPDSVLPKSNQMGFFGRVQRPGGFDEPIELEGPLPWELGGPRSDSGA